MLRVLVVMVMFTGYAMPALAGNATGSVSIEVRDSFSFEWAYDDTCNATVEQEGNTTGTIEIWKQDALEESYSKFSCNLSLVDARYSSIEEQHVFLLTADDAGCPCRQTRLYLQLFFSVNPGPTRLSYFPIVAIQFLAGGYMQEFLALNTHSLTLTKDPDGNYSLSGFLRFGQDRFTARSTWYRMELPSPVVFQRKKSFTGTDLFKDFSFHNRIK